MLTLYHCANARSFRPLWTLEELGLLYDPSGTLNTTTIRAPTTAKPTARRSLTRGPRRT